MEEEEGEDLSDYSDYFDDDLEDEEERKCFARCIFYLLYPISCCFPCSSYCWCFCFRSRVSTTMDLLDRLREVYSNNGGIIIDSNKFDREDESGLDPFESLCYDVNKKLDWIDRRIKLYQEKRRKTSDEMELSLMTEGIQRFIRSVQNDERKLREIFKNDTDMKYISYYNDEYHIGMDKREKLRRFKLIESIKIKTIEFQDELDKDVTTQRREAAKAKVKAEMERDEDDDDELHISEEDRAGSTDDEMEDEYEEGYIIKVQFIARKIKALRKKSEGYMEQINQNLVDLLDISAFTKKKLEEGNTKLFESLIPKTESIMDLQEKCANKLDKAASQASKQVQWFICAISAIVLMLFFALGFIALAVVIASF